MSRLEQQAKPLLLDLLNLKSTLLQLSESERTLGSAWAIKTAFMICERATEKDGTTMALVPTFCSNADDYSKTCVVLAAQLPFLNGFLYACHTDETERGGPLCQVRVGFSIRDLHFVVVIPLIEGERIIRTSGVHIPLWPLDSEIRVRYRKFPATTSPNDLINFLVGLVEAGIVRA